MLTIRQNKTDTNDARGLAELTRYGAAPRLAVHIKSAEVQYLRSRLVVREQIIKQQGATRSALRDLLRTHGSNLSRLPPPSKLRLEVLGEVERLERNRRLGLGTQALALVEIAEATAKYLRLEDRALSILAQENEVTRRFLGVPGIGAICAISFYTAIEDPTRFGSSSDAAAYLGLVPRIKQSGQTALTFRITKCGNKLTRGHVVMAASVLLSRARAQCALADWGRALVARVGYAKGRIAVARKLAVLLLSLWKNGREFEAYPEATRGLVVD
jgi:transposase